MQRNWQNSWTFFFRVNYRKEQLDKKIEERKVKEDQKAEEEMEKERRLEALREQVGRDQRITIVLCKSYLFS